MWADFCKRWFDLCCWWLPTPKDEQKSDAETKTLLTMADEVSTEVKTTGCEEGVASDEDDADDLTVIKGIGPAVQTKLRSFGVTSLAALAAADPEALAAKLKASQPISSARVKGWIAAAQDQITGRT